MDVTISDNAKNYVIDRGGTVYVRTTHNRCCSGTLTKFDITTDEPADSDRFSTWNANGVDVRYLTGSGSSPNELSIDLKGRRRPRLEAYWDGCLYRP